MRNENPAALGASGAVAFCGALGGANHVNTPAAQPQLPGAPDATNIVAHRFGVTLFDDAKAAVAREFSYTLYEVAAKIFLSRARTKAELPWIKLAVFGEIKSAGGSLRHNDNVLAFSGIELDYDGEQMSVGEAAAKLKELRCRCLIYTSPSHTPERPRWRLLLPTSQEIQQPELRKVLVGRVDGFFGRIFASESYALSTSYYFGKAENNSAELRSVIIDGDFVDLRDDLARFDAPQPPDFGPEALALMEQYAGAGVSTRPEDNPPQMTVEDLEMELRFALAAIPSDDYALWFRIGAAIHNGLGDGGFELFDEWSRECPAKYSEYGTRRKWEDIRRISSIRASTVFYHADQHDPGWRDQWRNYLRGGTRA